MENQTGLSEIESQEETNINTQEQEETLNNEPEIDIPERIPEPWESAPDNMIYPEKINDNGRLGSYTLSAEMAYRLGTFENGIPLADVEFSDIDDWPYLKDKCPHKTPETLLTEARNNKLSELKKKSLEALETAYVDSSLGFRVDANTTAVRDLEGLVIIADSSVMFCDFNNEFHALTKEQVQTLQREVLLNGQNLYAQKWTFRNRIESAESIEDLNDIQISFEMLDFSSL